jgi:hypothetical protein
MNQSFLSGLVNGGDEETRTRSLCRNRSTKDDDSE